ncbi:MAG: endonuclease III domain-containing protein [Candidatus Omnitrophica bacterium]|nr:endonuclease III domain-containing protein [Candidatus Omnitrophota bacterium]
MARRLKSIYQKLYSSFGSQHWWPADSPFEVMIGAILTQNTNWLNVEKAISNLRKNKLLNPRALYKLPHKRLATLIRPAGYYNIKTKRLKNFLGFFIEHYSADPAKMSGIDTYTLRQQLLSVNGIGPETADSILLYALNRPIFVVDAYTKRILSRHHFINGDATYEETQELFMKNLKSVVKLFNEYHALLVRIGKEFCLKNKPKCDICPLEKA